MRPTGGYQRKRRLDQIAGQVMLVAITAMVVTLCILVIVAAWRLVL